MKLTEHLVPSDRPKPEKRNKPGGSGLGYNDSVTDLPPAFNERACRAVAARAADAEDARFLLDVLGLIEPGVEAVTPSPMVTDCEPAIACPLPVAVEVSTRTVTIDGSYISDVPTRGLL